MDEMITSQSMSRRDCYNGDGRDYLPTNRPNNGPVENHGIRAQLKTIHRRRDRRLTRATLRDYAGV
jgi:hypothetical protein